MTGTAPLDEPAAWDAFVAGNELGLVPPADRLGAGQGGQRVGERPRRRRRRDADRGTGPPPAAAPAALGVRLRTSRPGGDAWTRSRSPRSPRRSGPARWGASRTSGSTRRWSAMVRSIPAARSARTLAARVAAGAADPAAVDARHRPRRRRGRALGRPAQEVAAVREQGPIERRDRGGAARRPDRAVLRDLPRDRGAGRLPDPRGAGLSRRLGCLPSNRRRDDPVRDRRARARRRPPSSWCAPAAGWWSRTAG